MPVSPAAQAATIPVTNPSSATGERSGNATIPSIPGCSLRDAITAANTDTATGGCPAGRGADIIVLAASAIYTLTVVDNTDPSHGPNGLPVITSDITIDGNGSTLIRSTTDGIPEFRFFQVESGGWLRLRHVTLSNGKVASGYLGGAIFNQNGGTVTITSSTLSANSADNNGGAIFNNQDATLTVNGTTFTGNSALNGGGIYNWGTVTAANSTFTGNSASFGGGINNGNGNVTIINSTLAGNSASTSGGNLYNTGGSTIMIRNTIVADSVAGGNCSGAIGDGGNNLRWPASDTSCVGAFGDPKLGALADNGGPTQTMALQSGSAALEKGNTTVCAIDPVNGLDQRGASRPNPTGTTCDIGAFEASLRPAPAITKTFNPIMVLAGQSSTLTFRITNPNSAGSGFTGVTFTDTLPPDLAIADPPNMNNDCGGILSATGGGGIITLKGGILLPGATCTIEVDVSSQELGTYINTTDAVSSTESGAGDPSNSAILLVVAKIYESYLTRIFR